MGQFLIVLTDPLPTLNADGRAVGEFTNAIPVESYSINTETGQLNFSASGGTGFVPITRVLAVIPATT